MELAAKSAILLVGFATVNVNEGLTRLTAALEATRLRFRPILTTSFAFILGVLPPAFSTGAGAAAWQSIATTVMGGMIAATFRAIFLVSLFSNWRTTGVAPHASMLLAPPRTLAGSVPVAEE